jgi:hypothetical protein
MTDISQEPTKPKKESTNQRRIFWSHQDDIMQVVHCD